MAKKRKDEPIGFTVRGIIAMAGGCGKVASTLGVSVQTVTQWSRRIPSQHARDVAIMSGLPLAIVRPDLVQDSANNYK